MKKLLMLIAVILIGAFIGISFAEETKNPNPDFDINLNEGEYNLIPFFYDLQPKLGIQNVHSWQVYGIGFNEIPVAYLLDPIKKTWIKVVDNGQYTAEYNQLIIAADENAAKGDYILYNYLRNTGILIYWPPEKTYDAGNNLMVSGNLVYIGKESKEYIGDSARLPEYNLKFYQGWNIVFQTEKNMLLGFDGQVRNGLNAISDCNLLKIAYMRNTGEWKIVQPEEFDNLPNLLSEDSVSGDILLIKVENDCKSDLKRFMMELWENQGRSDDEIKVGLAALQINDLK